MLLSSLWGIYWKKMREQPMLPAGCTAQDYRDLGLTPVFGPILLTPLDPVQSSHCFYFHTISSSAKRLLRQFPPF